MTTRSEPGGGRPDQGLDAIMSERRQLVNLAYRLLGSLAEAEDAVQETHARWYAMSAQRREAIANPCAWLTKVASRICLDLLGSAHARREQYVGEWGWTAPSQPTGNQPSAMERPMSRPRPRSPGPGANGSAVCGTGSA